MAKGGWEVSEAEYTPVGEGPGEDTETFYAGTPAPGERERWEEPPSQSSLLSRTTPGWIKRVARPASRPDAQGSDGNDAEGGLPLGLIAAGVVGLSGLLITTMVVGWFLFSPAKVSETTRSAKQDAGEEEPKDEEFQGVKVKKGLQ